MPEGYSLFQGGQGGQVTMMQTKPNFRKIKT